MRSNLVFEPGKWLQARLVADLELGRAINAQMLPRAAALAPGAGRMLELPRDQAQPPFYVAGRSDELVLQIDLGTTAVTRATKAMTSD